MSEIRRQEEPISVDDICGDFDFGEDVQQSDFDEKQRQKERRSARTKRMEIAKKAKIREHKRQKSDGIRIRDQDDRRASKSSTNKSRASLSKSNADPTPRTSLGSISPAPADPHITQTLKQRKEKAATSSFHMMSSMVQKTSAGDQQRQDIPERSSDVTQVKFNRVLNALSTSRQLLGMAREGSSSPESEYNLRYPMPDEGEHNPRPSSGSSIEMYPLFSTTLAPAPPPHFGVESRENLSVYEFAQPSTSLADYLRQRLSTSMTPSASSSVGYAAGSSGDLLGRPQTALQSLPSPFRQETLKETLRRLKEAQDRQTEMPLEMPAPVDKTHVEPRMDVTESNLESIKCNLDTGIETSTLDSTILKSSLPVHQSPTPKTTSEEADLSRAVDHVDKNTEETVKLVVNGEEWKIPKAQLSLFHTFMTEKNTRKESDGKSDSRDPQRSHDRDSGDSNRRNESRDETDRSRSSGGRRHRHVSRDRTRSGDRDREKHRSRDREQRSTRSGSRRRSRERHREGRDEALSSAERRARHDSKRNDATDAFSKPKNKLKPKTKVSSRSKPTPPKSLNSQDYQESILSSSWFDCFDNTSIDKPQPDSAPSRQVTTTADPCPVSEIPLPMEIRPLTRTSIPPPPLPPVPPFVYPSIVRNPVMMQRPQRFPQPMPMAPGLFTRPPPSVPPMCTRPTDQPKTSTRDPVMTPNLQGGPQLVPKKPQQKTPDLKLSSSTTSAAWFELCRRGQRNKATVAKATASVASNATRSKSRRERRKRLDIVANTTTDDPETVHPPTLVMPTDSGKCTHSPHLL